MAGDLAVHPPGLFQILVMALIVLLLFGRGRISRSMGELGEGVKAFRQRLEDEEASAPLPVEGSGAQSTLEPHTTADK
jgi:sec-independent protein translocase protein TatA